MLTDNLDYLSFILVITTGIVGYDLTDKPHTTSAQIMIFCVLAGCAALGMLLMALTARPRQKRVKALEDRIAQLEAKLPKGERA